MFRIRKIHDAVSRGNLERIAQIQAIIREQFPLATAKDIAKLPAQLADPLKNRFRSVIFVAEDSRDRIRGFALMLHFTDLDFCYLEYISAAPGQTGGGVGGVLYERVRSEALALGALGLIFEVLPDEPHLTLEPDLLPQHRARLRFYERYGARPILNAAFDTPLKGGYGDLLFLVLDDLGTGEPIRRDTMQKIARAILERKYGLGKDKEPYIRRVVETFRDDPIRLREPRHVRKKAESQASASARAAAIPLVVNRGHDIHHVRDRGYVEAPVRISSLLKELDKTGLFREIKARRAPERHILAVHDRDFVDYIRQVCARMAPGKSTYPVVFPVRNRTRPPKDMEIRAGYYCIDTFTPINHNAYVAARGAVDCAMTAADAVLGGAPLAYALVRPPGHHAERRAMGGFCYFNSAAIAAQHLSGYGKVAVLDIDYHHGNGTQDIFYERADVLTVSIHGHPNHAYPFFSGFEHETGDGDGVGFNHNHPLSEHASPARYRRALSLALAQIRNFDPAYLVLSLGLDTGKGDPTGSWTLGSSDFHANGRLVGGMKLPTLIVQEGGYNNRTLGVSARHFFQGLWHGHTERRKRARVT